MYYRRQTTSAVCLSIFMYRARIPTCNCIVLSNTGLHSDLVARPSCPQPYLTADRMNTEVKLPVWICSLSKVQATAIVPTHLLDGTEMLRLL